MRYDSEWNRFPGAPSRGLGAPRQGFGPRGGEFERGYDTAFYGGPDPRGAYADGYSQAQPGIYGPERYGLGPYHERLRTRRRPDAELKEEVREALFYDTWVDAEAVEVEVKDGIVTLRGDLPDYEEIRYATDDVWDVDGVLGVRSELRVRPEE